MEKVRLDKYLAKVLGVPRAQIAHLIDKKMVLVNGMVAKKSEIVGEGDKVEIAESSASNSSLGLHSADFANLGCETGLKSAKRPKFAKNHESQTENPSVVDSALNAQNLGENSEKNAKSATFCNATIFCHSERSEESQKNNRDSSPTAQNDNFKKNAESALDSANPAPSTQEANSTIADEFLGFCEASDKDKTKVYRGSEPMQSLKSRCESKFAQIQRIYEDDDILILNKPPFLATHGAPSLKEPSLVEWLKAHKIQRSTISGELREGIVHRLDKQTSGALVVAKNNDAHNALSAQLADKTMGRLYLAIIDLPLKEDIEIECYLARNPKNRLKISKVDVRKYKKFTETQKDLCEAPENSPASWCKKSESKGAVVPPADFLLEAESRGSPLKSEKRQLLGTHLNNSRGEREQGGAALLRKEKDNNENAEFERDLQSGLPRAINCARNDDSFRDSSPAAQNDKVKNSQNLPKFARYSKSKFYKLLPSKDGKKELILAKLFTGRTHQIRAHLESINRHIVGDELYGYKRGRGEGERVMLHAYLLELTHPKESSAGNSVLGMQFRTCENFGESTDSSLVLSPKFSQIQKPHRNHFDCDSLCESTTNQTKITEFSLDSANSQNLKNGLPRSPALARNDDSAKLRFIAPLFDDMKDYLAKNFDMEKVYEILHGLPARAF